MKLKFLRRLYDYEDMYPYQDGYIAVNYMGLTFLDSNYESKNEDMVSFNGGVSVFVTEDHRYIIERNLHGCTFVYDYNTRERLGFLDLASISTFQPFPYTMSLDGKSIMTLVGIPKDNTVTPMFPDEYIANCNVELREYSLPDIKEYRNHNLPYNCSQIAKCSFLNGYLLMLNDHTFCFYKDGKYEMIESFKAFNDSFVIDEKRHLFYIATPYGMRVYDKNFIEINKIDTITDEEKEVNNTLLSFDNPDDIPDLNEFRKVRKEVFISMMRLGEDHLIFFSTEVTHSYSKIVMYSLDDFHKEDEVLIRDTASQVSVLGDDKIIFYLQRKLHIMELTND